MIKSQAQVSYGYPLFTLHWDEDIYDWEIIDGDNDGNTWVFGTYDEKPTIKYSAKKGQNYDCATTKSFTLNDKKDYVLKYKKKASKGMEYSIVLRDKLHSVKLLRNEKCEEDDTEFSLDSVTFNVDYEDQYQIVLMINNLDIDEGAVEMYDMKISYSVRPEISFTILNDLKSGYRKKDDSFILEITNNGDGKCTTLKSFYTINGGEPVYFGEKNKYYVVPRATIWLECDKPISYETYGTYDIDIVVQCDGDTITSNDTISYTIENREYAEMPFFEDYEDVDYEINKIIEDPYNSEYTWVINNSESDELYKDLKDWGNFMTCTGHREWMFLPPVKLEPGYYAVEFDFIDPYETGVWIDLFYGKEATIEGMVNTLGETSYEGRTKSHAFYPVYISETQDFIVGMQTYYGWQFINVIDNVSIKAIEKPTADADLIYLNCHDYNTMREGFSNLLRRLVINRSMDETITVNEKLESEGQIYLEGQTEITPLYKSFRTFTLDMEDVTAGRKIFSWSISSDDDTNPNNNYAETEVLICKDPYLFYDFENGIPEGAELIVADEGTSVVAPENAAWYIDKNEGFKLNSKQSLTSSSDIGTEGATADRWFIMPSVHIGNGDADIVWEDCYVEIDKWKEHEFEKYQVLVSTTDASLESFKVVGEFKASDEKSKLRRIILDEYAGNDVYIAFRLYSDCGQCVSIDNIGLYGDFQEVHTSINEVAENGSNVSINGDMLNVNAVADRIEIIDIDGRIIATAQNVSTMNIASLSSGVYMARIGINGTVNTVKFVR